MRLNDQQVEALRRLYHENDYPSDRIFRNEQAAKGLAQEYERREGLLLTPDELKAQLERIRKSKQATGGLPRLGRSFSGPKFVPDN